MDLRSLSEPIVQAPMAGGPSTPALAAAVGAAGGLGFLAAGLATVDAVAADIAALRGASGVRPFGLNLFARPSPPACGAAELSAFAASLADDERRYGVAAGAPAGGDDGYDEKIALAIDRRVPIISFTFGCPSALEIERLHEAGSDVWVTVTSPAEGVAAHAAGADVLVAQGIEAGGHQGTWDDAAAVDGLGLLALLRPLAAAVPLPLVAAGGLMDGAGIAAALAAGAVAAQLGTAFLRTPEAGTSAPHRDALAAMPPAATRLTRAFTGRRARGIVNRFLEDHDDWAPPAYPEVLRITTSLRAAAGAAGDADGLPLWAGQAYPLARGLPASELVRVLGAEARAAAADAAARLGR